MARAASSARSSSALLTVLVRDSVWYCMRGLRPTSPNTITHALRGAILVVMIPIEQSPRWPESTIVHLNGAGS